jgi:hypothetical protein
VRPAAACLPSVVACALLLAPAAAAKTVTIEVISVGLTVRAHDRPPKGTSKGDTVVQRDRLVNATKQFGKKRGTVIGSDHGTMTFTGAHSARFRGSAVLPGGTLTLNGKVSAGANGYLAIPVTAGTGRYEGAKGILIVGPGQRQALNVYRLTIAGTVA